RCSGDSKRRPLALPAGNEPATAGLWLPHLEGTSGLQSGEDACPRPCKPHPCPRHRAFQGCGSARRFARGVTGTPSWCAHVRLSLEASQRILASNSTWGLLAARASSRRAEYSDSLILGHGRLLTKLCECPSDYFIVIAYCGLGVEVGRGMDIREGTDGG